jgi:hypothetical protein
MGMRRYLVVLDMDFLAADEEFDLEPINYLVVQQEQGPLEAVVLSLADTSAAKLPAMEMLLGAGIGKMPIAPTPRHDIVAAAEHRMNLTVRHLTSIGCQADGIISDDDDLVKVVRSEVRSHDYTAVLLLTGRPHSSALARWLHLDPVHRLRRSLRDRLVLFPLAHGAPHPIVPS